MPPRSFPHLAELVTSCSGPHVIEPTLAAQDVQQQAGDVASTAAGIASRAVLAALLVTGSPFRLRSSAPGRPRD